MSDKKINRKIAVIFATDVVGYSKHMEADESETILNLRECEAMLMGLFGKHDGRLFNTGGDSFLAEFPSAVSAVECAVEFQNAIKLRNDSEYTTVKLEFRIGINSGDVVKEKENLLGDGVNIAARLEALAQTGGITLSKSVYDFVKGKTSHEFNDIGLQKVKQNEFHAYDLILDQSQRRKIKTNKIGNKVYATVISLFLIIGFASAYWVWHTSSQGKTDQLAYEVPSVPSIAILPFKSLYEVQGTDYVAEGISQNLTHQLSRSSELFVITYSSVKKISNEFSDPKLIADSLGVRFILDGSIQRSNDDVRVNVELIDTLEDITILSKQFDGKANDLFNFQDEIAGDVFSNFKVKLAANLIGHNATNFYSVAQMQKILEFRENFLKFSKDGYLRARELAREINLEYPDSGQANIALAWLRFQEVMMGMTDDREKSIEEGVQYAEKAHAIMNDGMSLIVGAWMDLFSGKSVEEARKKAAKAIEIDQSGDVISGAANILLLTGDPLAAKQQFKRAMKVSPFHPVWYANRLSEALIMLEEYEEAYDILEELVSKSQEDGVNLREKSRALVALSFVESRTDKLSSAKNRLVTLQLINPSFSAASVKNYLGMVSDKEFLNAFLDNAVNLGLPEK